MSLPGGPSADHAIAGHAQQHVWQTACSLIPYYSLCIWKRKPYIFSAVSAFSIHMWDWITSKHIRGDIIGLYKIAPCVVHQVFQLLRTQTWHTQPYLMQFLGSTAFCSMCCICTAEQKLTFILLSFHRYSSSNRPSSAFQWREKWKGPLFFSWSSFLFPPPAPSVSNQILPWLQIAGLTLSKLWSGLLVAGSFALSTSVL